MDSLDFGQICTYISSTSRKSHKEDSEYLSHIQKIVSPILKVPPGSQSESLEERVSLFNDQLEKFGVTLGKEEIRIWKESEDPLLKEAAKFLEIKGLIDGHFPEKTPGCNLVLMHGDKLIASHSVGYSHLEEKKPMSLDQRQHFGSVSKHFTASCVLQLSDELGPLFSLTDDIRKHFPDLPRFYYEGEEVTITIDDLLRMRSGLPNMQVLIFLVGRVDQEASSEDKLRLLTSQSRIDLATMPGKEFDYCNTNYDILAEIVKNVLLKEGYPETNLKEYATSHLFVPSGMNDSGFIDPKKPIEDQTMPGYIYNKDEKSIDKITTQNVTWGPCGIIGTPLDMVKWHGRCPPHLHEQLTELTPEDLAKAHENFTYARGLNVGFFDHDRYKISVHTGGIEGFMTRYVKVTDLENEENSFGIFLSTNIARVEDIDFINLSSTIVNTWIGKKVIPEEKEESPSNVPLPVTAVDEKLLDAYEGNFTVSSWNTEARFEKVAFEKDKWGLKFMPDRNQPKMGMDFVQDSKDPSTFYSIDPPTAKLVFNTKQTSVLFSDISKGILGIKFKRQQ